MDSKEVEFEELRRFALAAAVWVEFTSWEIRLILTSSFLLWHYWLSHVSVVEQIYPAISKKMKPQRWRKENVQVLQPVQKTSSIWHRLTTPLRFVRKKSWNPLSVLSLTLCALAFSLESTRTIFQNDTFKMAAQLESHTHPSLPQSQARNVL